MTLFEGLRAFPWIPDPVKDRSGMTDFFSLWRCGFVPWHHGALYPQAPDTLALPVLRTTAGCILMRLMHLHLLCFV
jgi:hypothetical protein